MIAENKLKDLEHNLKYNFTNQDLLIEAVSHPSLRQNNNRARFDYERLELLGDAILNFVITEILFIKYPRANEGWLAKIRSYLVCKETLYNIAMQLDLADYIIMTQGEENSNGRANPSNLENATEALIAAVYLDGGLDKLKKIVKKLWGQYTDNIGDFSDYDPKTALQELSQSKKLGIPIYEVIEQTGSAHDPLFIIRVSLPNIYETAEGKSIKIAQKEAARKLLKILKEDVVGTYD